jgi:hypothetical protein
LRAARQPSAPVPAHDHARSPGDPDEFNYGTPGGLGSSAFTGESAGAMGGLLAESYAGRGPLGWRRPDASVLDDIHHVLTYSGDVDASDVEVAVTRGEVTLTGTVPDRATKRRIEDLTLAVSGVVEVFNNLRAGERRDVLGDMSSTAALRPRRP